MRSVYINIDANEQDIFVSVLEASATKRDAKNYLQKYADQNAGQAKPEKRTSFHPSATVTTADAKIDTTTSTSTGTDTSTSTSAEPETDVLKTAVVVLREPQALDDATLQGIARTLSQLCTLGLVSLVVVDGGAHATPKSLREQSQRLATSIHEFHPFRAKVLETLWGTHAPQTSQAGVSQADGPQNSRPQNVSSQVGVSSQAAVSSQVGVSPQAHIPAKTPDDPSTRNALDPGSLYLASPNQLQRVLQREAISILPSLAYSYDHTPRVVVTPPERLAVALTRYLGGLETPVWDTVLDEPLQSARPVSVERMIVLDPRGTIPVAHHPEMRHRFINLEQEYTDILHGLHTLALPPATVALHQRNLSLAKEVLALLPSSSSALIASPSAAASLPLPSAASATATSTSTSTSTATPCTQSIRTHVHTRKYRNPLIHNLLTDRPVFSSSLPLERIRGPTESDDSGTVPAAFATLIKRGMPLTIHPDPRREPWTPPPPPPSVALSTRVFVGVGGGQTPAERRPSLTDPSMDWDKLVYLMEDSFGKRLDVDHYRRRVRDTLAGVIVAGDFEGAAILTWEVPAGIDRAEAYRTQRYVPYLDKFAVLRRSQGSAGVADVVFNAMVLEAFPRGVCWRSRQSNPVNKWYFERSVGTQKLDNGSPWTMFWTTPGLAPGSQTLRDYESVCRQIEPSLR